MSDKETMLARIQVTKGRLVELLDEGLEPEDFSDPDKLRLYASLEDVKDIKRGVYDRTGVQDDLRRIADDLERLSFGASAGASLRMLIESIIDKGLQRDTVHIEYHRESVDMVGHIATDILAALGITEAGQCLSLSPETGTRCQLPMGHDSAHHGDREPGLSSSWASD